MAKTFSVIAQSAFQTFAARSGATYTADAYGTISGVPFPDVSDLIVAGCNIVGTLDQLNNLSATTDPTVSNDNTQDYSVGSLWLNTSNSRAWRALSVATGAAVWILEGVVPGVGIEPSNMITQFGSATGALSTFTEEGNLYRAESLAGIGNAADTTDDVLFSGLPFLPAPLTLPVVVSISRHSVRRARQPTTSESKSSSAVPLPAARS
ncbi:hypothetical protein [Acidicapsa acidisoli]|uniref:hypothetical protein n=1 Tax=Acidicapsa acidisoli TaxID=1615681 RepID=UPI0021DFC3AE|nr:hypothetical protein [Acidicapsa acidisoli]